MIETQRHPKNHHTRCHCISLLFTPDPSIVGFDFPFESEMTSECSLPSNNLHVDIEWSYFHQMNVKDTSENDSTNLHAEGKKPSPPHIALTSPPTFLLNIFSHRPGPFEWVFE